jgi:hypothetical protein
LNHSNYFALAEYLDKQQYLYKLVITSPSESIVDNIDVPTDVEECEDSPFEDFSLLFID